MTYAATEQSVDGSQPVELFLFEGTYSTYRMTSHQEDVTSGSQLFIAKAITRNKLNVGTEDNSDNSLEITLPFDDDLVREYAYQSTPPKLVFTLKRAHLFDLNDTVTMWVGNVTNFAVEDNVAKCRVPSLFSYILQGSVPSPRYQSPCNHVLYDSRCGVVATSHQETVTVSEVTGRILSVDTLALGTNEASAGFIFNASGEARMVISNSGLDIVLNYPFSGVAVDDVLTIRKGCDHSRATCLSKFNNVDRFGGFPLIPAINPYLKSSLK